MEVFFSFRFEDEWSECSAWATIPNRNIHDYLIHCHFVRAMLSDIMNPKYALPMGEWNTERNEVWIALQNWNIWIDAGECNSTVNRGSIGLHLFVVGWRLNDQFSTSNPNFLNSNTAERGWGWASIQKTRKLNESFRMNNVFPDCDGGEDDQVHHKCYHK